MSLLFTIADTHRLQSAAGDTPVTAAPLTMACHYRITASHNGTLMSIVDASVGDHLFALRNDTDPSAILAQARAGDSAIATTTNTVANGVWAHAAAIFYSATLRRSFLNADDANNGENTDSVTPAGIDSIGVGALVDVSPGFYFGGDIEDPAVWNVALLPGELQELRFGKSPKLVRPQNLVWHLPLRHQVLGAAAIYVDEIRGIRLPILSGLPVVGQPFPFRKEPPLNVLPFVASTTVAVDAPPPYYNPMTPFMHGLTR